MVQLDPSEMPSSGFPSQSLSTPSQTSEVGSTSPLQKSAPFLHSSLPNWQGGGFDTPQSVVPLYFVGRLSSGVPLQSLSVPSQISVPGPTAFLHTQPVFPLHVNVPTRHGAGVPESEPSPVQVPPGG